jgi:hypothetical protein
MPAVGDLHCVRRTLGYAGRIGFRPIPRHDRHLGMRLKPSRHGLGGAVLKEVHRAVPIQIHHDRAIRMALAFGPIVDTDGTRLWGCWRGEAAHPAQEGLTAAGDPLAGQVPRPRRASEG